MMSLPHCAKILVHPSQFPESVRAALAESLRSRNVNHKFHYDSHKQAEKWLALHEAYSPSRTDPNCKGIYDRSFERVADQPLSPLVHVVGLGCGGGQKDACLLRGLRDSGKEVVYTPLDVSMALVLVARRAALAVVEDGDCFPVVCDLGMSQDLGQLLDSQTPPGASRILTFFGMIPNFEPAVILPRLAGLVRPGDHLLFSANLAPGPDYRQGIERILPLYDNELTRDWLLTFLLDLGFERHDGRLEFGIEHGPAEAALLRVTATYGCEQRRMVALDGESFEFQAGDRIRLFFSYRHTPEMVRVLLQPYGLLLAEQWISGSGEEGVFLVRRK